MVKLSIFIILSVLSGYFILRQIRIGNKVIRKSDSSEAYNFKQRRSYWDFYFFRELCEDDMTAFICLRYFYGLTAIAVISGLLYVLVFWIIGN